MFAMGIGYDVNVRLLDRLVAENRGISRSSKNGNRSERKDPTSMTRSRIR